TRCSPADPRFSPPRCSTRWPRCGPRSPCRRAACSGPCRVTWRRSALSAWRKSCPAATPAPARWRTTWSASGPGGGSAPARLIAGRPAARADRAWKGARRGRAAAALLALSLLVVAVGFPAGPVLWLRADHALRDEAQARQEEVRQRQQAERAFYGSQVALAK